VSIQRTWQREEWGQSMATCIVAMLPYQTVLVPQPAGVTRGILTLQPRAREGDK
jgi:hypothetical protein